VRAKILVAAAAAALGAAIAVPAIGAPGSPQGGTGGPVACGPTGSVTWTPSNLWPPNHKYRTVTITFTGSSAGTPKTVQVTSWTVDDGPLGAGQPNQPTADVLPGATGTGTDQSVSTSAMVRSERAGNGDGRTYTLTVHCTEGAAAVGGDAQIQITVPHDQRPTS
jgi:endo-1,4-beta-xylanase